MTTTSSCECVPSATWRLHKEEFLPQVLVADGAIAIANGFIDAFQNSRTRIVMCYFHVKYAIKEYIRTANADAVLREIDHIQTSSTQSIFERAVELFEEKFQDVESRFCQCFVRNWDGMYEPGCASTNNAIEGFNGMLKKHYTYHKLSQIGVLFSSLGRVLRSKSQQYTEMEIIKFPTVQIAWTEAIKWTQLENLGSVLKIKNARKAIFHLPSAQMRTEGRALTKKLKNDHKSLVGMHLEDLMELTRSIYRLEVDPENWQK